MNCKFFTIACALLSMSFCSWANENKTDSVGYQFTVTKELKTNPVKDQSRSGTCWSFSTLSFIEDDLLRQGKPAVDLSEMFIVRNDYIEKAIKYVRMHGDIAFSAGGSAYDVLYIIDKYGIVPEEVYTGLNYGTDKHQHGELDAILKCYHCQPQQKTFDGMARWIQSRAGHLFRQSSREVYLQRRRIHTSIFCKIIGYKSLGLCSVDIIHPSRFLQTFCH